MFKIRFVSVGAFYCRINETGAVLTESLEECACVPAVSGAGTLIAGIECSVAPIRPEVRSVPERHQSEHACLNAKLARWPVALQQMQFLETLENPEGEIDFDSERI
jgi:hypothetical protein